MRRPLLLLAAPALAFAVLLAGDASIFAQAGAPTVSTSVESRFPDGLRFDVTITGPVEITEARVRFRVLGESVTRNAPLEFEPGRRVEGDLLVRTDTAQRYIPPGAEIEYAVDVTDATGARTESATERFIFLDPRFEWSRLDAPGVYLHFYGGQEGRARRALEAAQDALVRMSDVMGIEERDTLRLTVYNGISDMRDALPPRSVVQEGSLVTEGISFGDTGVVLLLGGNPEVEGVAAHETVHFLMRFAVGRGASVVPAWLNEGLAEYANPYPSFSFERVFSRRLYDNTLLPLTSLTSPPGRPEDTLLMYGQSESVVTYMIETYGEEPMQQLLRGLRDSLPIDDALMAAYGIDRTGLEQEWRLRIGALPLAATPSRSALPTPIPRPTLVPFGVGTTPAPAATSRPLPSEGEAQGTTEPAAEASSGGCNRAEGDTPDAAIVVSLALLLGFVWRRRRGR